MLKSIYKQSGTIPLKAECMCSIIWVTIIENMLYYLYALYEKKYIDIINKKTKQKTQSSNKYYYIIIIIIIIT